MEITDVEYTFGSQFNYALWTNETVLTMANVPWNNDYRDIVKFENHAALNAYINAMESANTRIAGVSHAKLNAPIRINVPFNKAMKYNYIRASNPLQPGIDDIQKDYYYFITDVRYIAGHTTEITVQLDVWQTFGYDIKFGNCYIERGHIGIANEKAFENYGRNYLTVPEGLDTGGEYKVVTKRNVQRMGASQYHVLVASTVDLQADQGTPENPKLVAASGTYMNNLPSGASYYVFNSGGSLHAYLNTLRNHPWVTQGIVSITLIPLVTDYYPGFNFGPFGTPTRAPQGLPMKITRNMFPDWRNNKATFGSDRFLLERYRHLKKFFTYPYMVIELTMFNGTPIIIKPESWADPNATVVESVSMMPPNQRIVVRPQRYNSDPDSQIERGNFGDGDDYGEYADFATLVQSFPTMAIVNNMATMFLAQNAHSLAFQNQAADWSQQKALRGNQMSYDQASSAMNLADQMGMTGRNQDILQTQLGNRAAANSAIVNALGGVAGGAGGGMVGGPAGAAIGGASAAFGGAMSVINQSMQQGVNNESLAIRNAAAVQNSRDSAGHAGYVRDTNKSVADWAARGDYEQTIAGMNAKVQDSKLTQPTTSGQVGGETHMLVNEGLQINVRWKFLDQSHARSIGEYWLRYGYAVQQFARIPDSLMCMEKFTYWKLTETYISTAPMPEGFKQAIRGMFEKGVTVWANPADIGNIDLADNAPLKGITL